MLENKLNIKNQIELAKEEERITKIKAYKLWESKELEHITTGTFESLKYIHNFLFEDIYEFAGKVRSENISKGGFRFAPCIYLADNIKAVEKMPQSNFDKIIEKYIEMNVCHPFCEGNGRSARIWLDLILKKELKKVINWNNVEKEDYLLAMQRSTIKDIEIKYILKEALTNEISARDIYLKGIDYSYYIEGYNTYTFNELLEDC